MSSTELHFEASRSGLLTCGLGSLSLHSAYDPQSEADRFVQSALQADKKPGLVLLLGPCLGYLNAAVRARLPGAAIASIQYSDEFRGRGTETADAVFYFDREKSSAQNAAALSAFLPRVIGPDSVSGLALLEWPPASRAYPAEAALCAHILREVLDRYASEANTTKTFGRRWILNAVRSSVLIEKTAQLRPCASPLVVAAAGPSLESSLDTLEAWRGRFVLFAVSSALAALRARGWEPDLVVSSDGGSWSRFHLYPLAADRGTVLASPLTALPSAELYAGRPLLLLNQGFFPENELTELLGGALALGGDATVSGTALRLAALATSGPIIAAGLDLATFDVRSHCEPGGFDFLTRGRESRLCPSENLIFEREWPGLSPLEGAAPWRSSRSLSLYAAALSAEAPAFGAGRRLYRLEPSPLRLEGFRELDRAGLAELMAGRLTDSAGGPPNGAAFSAAAADKAGTQGSGARAPDSACAADAGQRLERAELFAFRDAPPEEERLLALRRRVGVWRAGVMAAGKSLGEGTVPEGPSSETALEIFRAVDMADWAAVRRALLRAERPEPLRTELLDSSMAFLDQIEGILR